MFSKREIYYLTISGGPWRLKTAIIKNRHIKLSTKVKHKSFLILPWSSFANCQRERKKKRTTENRKEKKKRLINLLYSELYIDEKIVTEKVVHDSGKGKLTKQYRNVKKNYNLENVTLKK